MSLLAVTGYSHAKKPSATATSAPITLPATTAQVFTLPDGLTVIIDEDHSAPVASVQAWCETGSIDEDKWMGAGLSHILEHMLFKGTETRPPGSIARQVQDRGGYINAYTSFDRTVFYIDTPADGASEAVDILSDAVMNATLPPVEYAKEQNVIRREFAMGFDDPDRMSSQLMFRTVFSQSPFRHPVIGYLDIYNRLSREDVFAYYKRRYVPNNLVFVIVGDVDAAKIKAQIEATFEKFPRKPLEPVFVAQEPPQAGRRDAHEEFPTELTRLTLAWPIPAVTDPDMPALDLLGTVLGGGASTPLNQEIREKKRLAFRIDAGSYALSDGGIFAIQAICAPGNREAVEQESLAILKRAQKDGITAAELDKARKSLLATQLGALATVRGRAGDLGSNWLQTRNLNFSRDYLDAINRVTPDDLKRVANRYLIDDHLNVTSLNPAGSLAKKAVQPAGARETDVQKFELPNGLRLLVREDHKVPLVSLVAVFKGGLLAEAPASNGTARLMASSMLKGTASRTAEQIAGQIESVGGDISSDSGNNSFTISAGVMKPDLKLGLDLLADVLTNPTFPEDEVKTEQAAQLAAIKAEDDEPTNVARNLLRQKLFGAHPYAMRSIGSPEVVSKLAPAQLRALHDKLVVAKNGVLAVFGDVDAQEVYALAKKAFAALPPGGSALPNPAPAARLVVTETATANRPKNQAIVMVGYPGADLLSPDRPALELIDTASSDLGSRFFDRIREKMGLAYFIGTSQLQGPTPGAFVFYLGTDPSKVDQVRTEFHDEIGKLATGGLTAEELARAKKKLLGAEAIRDQSNSAMAQAIALDELFGLGADHYKKRKAEIESVTLDDTKRIAGKYFNQPGSVEVIVAPPK
ncbi:MAG: pitrilysin family protein [Terrimicrobiaceae bacterium]|nr:pitrilysin family protein [Terrimicrobiaceae bacterium]